MNELKTIFKFLQFLILLICIYFIGIKAFEYGSNRFLGIPFMILAVLISRAAFNNRYILKSVIVLCFSAIIFNIFILNKIAFFFPILDGGFLEIKRSGYLEIFPDLSTCGYSANIDESTIAIYQARYNKIEKGQIIPVTGIHFSGFWKTNFKSYRSNVYVETDLCNFILATDEDIEVIVPNKEIISSKLNSILF